MDSKKENQIYGLVLKWRVVVLYAVIFIPSFLPTDFFSPFLVFTGIFLLSKSLRNLKISYLNLVMPLIVVLFIGIIGLFGHEPRDILRDLFYALTPIALIYIGYWIAKDEKMWPKILEVLIIGGIIMAIIHLSIFIQNPEYLNADMFKNRSRTANPNISIVVLSLVLGIFQHRLKLGNLFPKLMPRYIALPLLLLSFILSFSRTGILIGVMLTVSILGYVGSIRLRTIVAIAIFIGSLFVFVITTPADEVGTFRSQIVQSLSEVAVSDYKDMTEIIQNWRGYETYKAIITFSSGNLKQIILGQGFGALVDLRGEI